MGRGIVGWAAALAVVAWGGAARAQGPVSAAWVRGGHASFIYAAAVSPDGKSLASGSADGTVKIWRTSDWTLLRTLRYWAWGAVEGFGLAWSPDSTMLAAAQSSLTLWRASDWQMLKSVSGPGGSVYGMAFTPDGSRILTAGTAALAAQVWTVPDLALERTIGSHTAWLYSVAVSPDGAMVATGSRDKTAKMWRFSDGAPLHDLGAQTTWVSSVAFSPDGLRLATAVGLGSNFVRLWEASTGRLLGGAGSGTWCESVAFLPGTNLLLAVGDAALGAFNATTGALIGSIPGGEGMGYSVAPLLDGKTVVQSYRFLNAFDAVARTHAGPVSYFAGSLNSVAVSPDGTTVAAAAFGDALSLWSAPTGGRIARVQMGAAAAAFSPDGATTACADAATNVVGLYRSSNGAFIRNLSGHTDRITSVAFLPGGSAVVSASWDKTARFWNASTGVQSSKLTLAGPISAMAVSPAGDMAAFSTQDGNITVRRIPAGDVVFTAPSPFSQPGDVAFSPDGAYLAGHIGTTLNLWRTSDWSSAGAMPKCGHIAFSPDSRAALIGGGTDPNNWLKLVGIPSLTVLRTWDQDLGTGVGSVAYLPSGAGAAVGRLDGTLALVVLPAPTTLTPAPASGKPAATVTLDALLTRSSGAVGGKQVTLTLDGSSVASPTTGADGHATAAYAIPVDTAPGDHALGASFAGDADLLASAGSAILTVARTDTSLYVPDRTATITDATYLRGYLTRLSDKTRVAGRSLAFAVAGTEVGSATTDATGAASLAWIVTDGAASRQITATFAGDAAYTGSAGHGALTAQTLSTKVYVPNRSGAIAGYTVLKGYLYRMDSSPVAGKRVAFTVDGVAAGSDTTIADGRAQAGYTIPEAGGAGSRTIIAAWAGDGGYRASSNKATLTAGVAPVYLWPYARSIKAGAAFTARAYVRRLPDYVILPGKSIAFAVDGTEIGSGIAAADGWAAATASSTAGWAAGKRTLTARFAGDGAYAASSASTSFTVVP
ncbi:MAG: Ig-like domain repeat protein [Armatimonadetes bacterium]|nr:Ig-like domain repeat protein [Armatimonadota bacterium]